MGYIDTQYFSSIIKFGGVVELADCYQIEGKSPTGRGVTPKGGSANVKICH